MATRNGGIRGVHRSVLRAYIYSKNTFNNKEMPHKYRKRFRNKFDTEAMESKISQLDGEISRTAGVAKLMLIKTRGDLANQLGTQGRAEEFEHLEAAFISIAKQFSIDRGISYDNWREIGVPVRTLAKAGVYPPNARRRPLPRPKNQR